MGRETSARRDQAYPLGWKEIKEFIGCAGESLRADRGRALLCVAYETLARRSELVALEVRAIKFHPSDTGQALIRRGKTDWSGAGEGGLPLAGDCEMAEGAAGTPKDQGGGGISATDREGTDWRTAESGKHLSHL